MRKEREVRSRVYALLYQTYNVALENRNEVKNPLMINTDRIKLFSFTFVNSKPKVVEECSKDPLFLTSLRP